MAEKGIDISKNESKGLGDIPTGEWDWVVTMGCGDSCPHVPAMNRADWELPDPKSLPSDQFIEVRDEIERRVKALLDLQ
jgi:protein-tyrosine-phosphatase